MPSSSLNIEFIPALQTLFVPKRLKVLWGGRSAGRSWGCGRALLIKARQRRIRVLCVREFQNSIEESVYHVFKDQIENKLHWEAEFELQKTKIIGRETGSEFLFEGVRNNTTRIKSYEGIDYCWYEEGAKATKGSWEIVEPTIRGERAEIWISLNPELATDFVYATMIMDKELREVPPERFGFPVTNVWETFPGEFRGMFSIKMNWHDNPWLPETMRDSLEEKKRKDPDAYLNIWEGFPRENLEGAVFAKELRAAREEGRICRVPYEPDVPVDTFWDLGRANNTAIWFIQRVAMQWRVLDYYEANREELSHYLKVMQQKGYFYGTVFLPHDAKHKRLGYKGSIEEQFRSSGYRVYVVPKMNLKIDGINAARVVFPNCYFDEENTVDGVNALRHYCFRVDAEGRLSDDPSLNKWATDAADAFQQFALTTKVKRSGAGARMEAPSEPLGSRLSPPERQWRDIGGLGWMR